MAQRASFRPNNKGIGLILRSKQMEREMTTRARVVESYAVADPPRDSGEYAASFSVESGQDKCPIKLGTADRAWAMVRNSAGHAAAVEFGNARVGEGQRVMGRAADRVTSE
ncbi:hypothetical protein [Sphaerisporangium sp. TRM90804]|uniref:hypothetical protein n=1 Tax=Sphaerisporangium sp. TRM90804 TaxID=3031113 RepID=UPI002446B02A|nr:hypothetical protein [Sphaerisporangium sp. TRM90804]MDH2424737.1 hypothetical protein [Sphaerisporangium sp. TRM90804]